jgi:hypothetical protein
MLACAFAMRHSGGQDHHEQVRFMALPPLDASQFGLLTRLRTALIFRWVAANNRRAEAKLRAMPVLWDDICHYVEKSAG